MIKNILFRISKELHLCNINKLISHQKFIHLSKHQKTNNEDKEKSAIDNQLAKPPDPPINCCMSGCQNCVWIQYVDDLLRYYGRLDKENLKKTLSEIEKMEDENLKNFLLMEIKFRLK
jgi:hypothetical protein